MHYFLNSIILLGALQGAIISTLLFLSKNNNRYANRLLGFFILILSLACFNLYAQESPLYGESGFIRWLLNLVPLILAMAIGPLLYFYTRVLIDPERRITKKERLHFLPVIIDCVPEFIVWYFIAGIMLGLITQDSTKGWGDFIDEYNAWTDIPRWLSLSIYTIFSRKIIYKALRENPGQGKSDYRWLTIFINFMIGFQILWFFYLIPYLIPRYRYQWLDLVGWYPLYIPITVMVYWMGIRGYIQSRLSAPRKSGASFPQETIESTIRALTKAMNESRLYLDAGLTATQLSTYLKIPQKTISGVLNQHLNKSFSEFLNEYRVEEVKKKLLAPGNEHLTITGIALECGFNSQATFQRAFKAVTQQSPTEFLAHSKRLAPTISE